MIKKLVIVALAVLAFGGTMSAYAWWDDLAETQNEKLTIGVETDLVLNVNATAPEGKVLVPSTVVLGANDVKSIVLSYDLNLSKEAFEALTLTTEVSEIEINGSTEYASLVSVVVSPDSTSVNADVVTITVTVTLAEPTTEAAYNAVYGKDIGFTLTFTAEQVVN